MDNQEFSKSEIREKIRISGLLRLEEMSLEVLLVCPRAMQTTQDRILLTSSFGNPFLLTLTSFRALFLGLWCPLSIPYTCVHTTLHLTPDRSLPGCILSSQAFVAVQIAMCVFTYDCFSYLLIDFLQIFVSKDFTAPLLIVWFYEQRLTEERASPASSPSG